MNLRQQFRLAGCCAIVLLAPFLGGSTERWAQGVVLLLLTLLTGLCPPRSFGARGFLRPVLLLAGVAALAFLPAAWFAVPAWRSELIRNGVPIASTLSPQPWVSAECAVLLLAGIVWIYWLTLQTWEPGERSLLIAVFVAGAAVLAAVALVAFYCRTPVPIWHPERGFGPFPNRNQSGNFFAISGILAIACTYEHFRRSSFKALWFAAASAIIAVALVLSYSRAAVILFFAGSCLWIVSLGFVSRSPKSIAVCVSTVMVLAAAFLIFGGETLRRFQGPEKVTFGFRLLIYKDAFSLVRASPWCGIGLGNFEGVFSLFRRVSAMPSRILHPESDWLWLCAEMGWLAVPLVLVSAGVLLKRVLPLGRGTDRRLRLAAAAAALVFAAHGVVDVPGHRLGSVLPGLFVLGMALNNPVDVSENRRAPWCFRLIALAIGVVGAAWLGSAPGNVGLPGNISVKASKGRAQVLLAGKEYPAATVMMTRATAWAPLDWELYFLRGTAEAGDGNWPRAFDDFRRVNILESTSPQVTYEQGKIWLNSLPSYAIFPWWETLRRSAPQEVAQYYSNMLACAAGNVTLFDRLHALAKGRFELELVYLSQAPREELNDGIRAVLQADPGLKQLTDEQKTSFFRLWGRSDDAADLTMQFENNPAWQRLAWRQIASGRAKQGDLKGACDTALQYMPLPVLPKIPAVEDVEELHHRLLRRPDDFLSGYALYTILMEQNNDVTAMQLLRGFTALPGCPRYFYYLEAEVAFRLQNFSAAWDSLQKYESIAEN